MRALLASLLVLMAACAERPLVGVTISNTPERGVCVPPKPGGGC